MNRPSLWFVCVAVLLPLAADDQARRGAGELEPQLSAGLRQGSVLGAQQQGPVVLEGLELGQDLGGAGGNVEDGLEALRTEFEPISTMATGLSLGALRPFTGAMVTASSYRSWPCPWTACGRRPALTSVCPSRPCHGLTRTGWS